MRLGSCYWLPQLLKPVLLQPFVASKVPCVTCPTFRRFLAERNVVKVIFPELIVSEVST